MAQQCVGRLNSSILDRTSRHDRDGCLCHHSSAAVADHVADQGRPLKRVGVADHVADQGRPVTTALQLLTTLQTEDVSHDFNGVVGASWSS